MEQSLGFEDSEFSNFVYLLFKALYGLKQAPLTWYDTLSEFLLENGFSRGVINKTLFIKMHKNDMILVQVYVDDIIFGSTNDQLCSRFAKLMQSKYEMSMMGELTYFLGLQVSQGMMESSFASPSTSETYSKSMDLKMHQLLKLQWQLPLSLIR